jgi:hypothetical protein
LAKEIAATYRGMMIAIEPSHWTKEFANLTTAELVAIVKQLAKNVHLAQFQKNSRGPKKPPPKRIGGLREKHVSTARLLEQQTPVTSSK